MCVCGAKVKKDNNPRMRARAAKQAVKGFRSSKRSGHNSKARVAGREKWTSASIPEAFVAAHSCDRRKDLKAASERNGKTASPVSERATLRSTACVIGNKTLARRRKSDVERRKAICFLNHFRPPPFFQLSGRQRTVGEGGGEGAGTFHDAGPEEQY